MGKPVVILADTDEKYLSPLELKFLEELNDTIELELITDEEYFNEHFSHPQNADVLVVSEELYSRDIQKHNIANIFVLTEQVDAEGTDDLIINKLFKYTSIKEIYNQIISTSSGIIDSEIQKTKETLVVLVYSASGGVGKTTTALGISACLAQSYKKVLYINAERINSFQHNLNNSTPMPASIYPELKNANVDLFNRIRHVIRNEKFDYLPPFSAAISSLNIDYSIYGEIVKSAKLTKEYDVILVDTDSVFDSEKAALITQANKVVMVVEQSKNSVHAMNMLLKNMSCNDNEKYYFVCNNFDAEKNNALVDSVNKPNFIVNEYIEHIENMDEVTITNLATKSDIQKVSFLVI